MKSGFIVKAPLFDKYYYITFLSNNQTKFNSNAKILYKKRVWLYNKYVISLRQVFYARFKSKSVGKKSYKLFV